MIRPVVFATVIAAASLPAATALSQQGGTSGQRSSQPQQGQGTSQPQQGQGTPRQPSGQAQQGAGERPSQAQGAHALSKSEREFIDEAALGGLYEVKAGQLAQQRAESQEVKQFGQRMIDEHTAVNNKLAQLAKQKGLTAPQALDKKHQDKLNKLSQKSGAEFDKEYMSNMVDDHQDDVDKFEKAAKDAKDPEVKSFAQSALPTLREHLTLAKQIRDREKQSSHK